MQVLLAAGQWTRQLARQMVGFDLVPTAIVPHQYLIFDKLDGVSYDLPVVRDYVNKFYLKPEVGGFMLGIFEGDPIPHFPQMARRAFVWHGLTLSHQVQNRNEHSWVERSASNELYEESWDKFSPWMENILELVPRLNDTGAKAWVHG